MVVTDLAGHFSLNSGEFEEPPPKDLIRYFRDTHGSLSFDECVSISRGLHSAGFSDDWCDNPKLYYILQRMRRPSLMQRFIAEGFTDLWIPLHKQPLSRLLTDDEVKLFILYQDQCLDGIHVATLENRHFSLEDVSALQLMKKNLLGEGGYGQVHRVKHEPTDAVYAMKTIERRGGYLFQKELMHNFKREVLGMRRVQHRHCVDLVASCTDTDYVVLICSPVADMDLSNFLNSDLTLRKTEVLQRAIGCITSAIVYLHKRNIRHDDLKPNNVLVHGRNILLTDFGFCLDSAESGQSTTFGRAKHFARRYSAPEVFGEEPRSRLTDVWGLGCLLFEILSHLRGCKLKDMETFWKANGEHCNSYADNPKATEDWYKKLTSKRIKTQHGSNRRDLLLLSYVYQTMLEPDRLLRPTAAQVFDKLKEMDVIYPVGSASQWVGSCCSGTRETEYTPEVAMHPKFNPRTSRPGSDPYFTYDLPQWPLLDICGLDSHLAYLLMDLNLSTVAHSDNLEYLSDNTLYSRSAMSIERLVVSSGDVKVLLSDIALMLDSIEVPRVRPKEIEFAFTEVQLKKSLQICRLRETASTVRSLNLSCHREALPTCHTVQLSLATMSLHRQPGYGLLFAILVFDPREGKVIDKSYMQGQEGLWTDALFDPGHERAARHTRWREIMGKRRRDHLAQVNKLRVIKKGFEKAKCVHCTINNLACSGASREPCGECRAAHLECYFNPTTIEDGGEAQRLLENEQRAEGMISVRWNS